MKPLLFYFSEDAKLANSLLQSHFFEEGKLSFRNFPDSETYLQIQSELKNKTVFLLCGLHQANPKILPALFFSETAKRLGAHKVILIAPYLAYMRQDAEFHPGESLSNQHFAKLLSSYFDALITVDPHLHRIQSLNEIFSIPSVVIHAAPLLTEWIHEQVNLPLLIGPDRESEQWVSEVAKKYSMPFLVLDKTRLGDREVEIELPNLKDFAHHQIVLVDDVISSGKTLLTVVKKLKLQNFFKIFGVAVHGLFADNSYEDLQQLGVSLATSNSISHVSNQIDLSKLILEGVQTLCLK